MSLFSSSVPTYLYATLLSGQYDIPASTPMCTVYTNTVPVDAYRGAGRPEATYLVERMMETAARELGLSPAEFRRKNFIREFPHQTPVIMCYDAGDYRCDAGRGDEGADYDGFSARKAEAAPRQAARHRHPATSRLAASRRQLRSDRSAPASAFGNRPKCGSIRWAPSRF
jgi:carbon-monoxide dehydrogenase large subunit